MLFHFLLTAIFVYIFKAKESDLVLD